MLFIRILNYLRGYLLLDISGRFPERFINICVRRGIRVWDVRSQGGVFRCKMAAPDFKNVRGIARVTGARPKITERRGLVFTLRHYRRRWPALIGIMVFLIIIYITATRVMSVDITGNSRVSEGEVRRLLSESGVRIGAAAKDIEPDRVRNEMILKNDALAWVGVNVRGSRVFIEIVERLDSESVPHVTDEECNLVASKDGVISRVEVRQGQTMVRRGDGVRAGDMLVSGVVDSVYGGFRLVHAFGEVYAETEYSETKEYSLVYTEREYTGEEKNLYGLELFGREFNLYPKSAAPGADFEEERSEASVTVPFVNAPFGGVLKKYRKFEEVEKRRTVREAVDTGIAELTPIVEQSVPEGAEITNRTNEHNILSGDRVEVTVTFECLENIAEEREIDKSLIDKTENLDYDIESNNSEEEAPR